MSDLTKSLKEIFDERISSPFYGSLIISWLLWNWKIPYVTFFVDQERLGDSTNKIDYIYKHCNNSFFLIFGPLISTALIILLIPFITNGAYWITEKFDLWRINKKKEIQGKTLLNEEDRIKLLFEIQEREDKYNNLFLKKDSEIREKDEEIKHLRERLEYTFQQLSLAQKEKKLKDFTPPSKTEQMSLSADLTDFLNNNVILSYFERIAENIQMERPMFEIPSSSINFCITLGLIERKETKINMK
jgi:hypothetical protein